jgi:hypothetical protein
MPRHVLSFANAKFIPFKGDLADMQAQYQRLLIFFTTYALILLLPACATQRWGEGKEIVLRLTPGPDNPRNSEGDFIKLNDGRILFIYTHFTGGSGDNAAAHLAGRFSDDDGRSWSKEDIHILSNEGGMNIMSVSLLRLSDNRIALFYLRKNSESDCIPYLRFSDDEAKTFSDGQRCIGPTGYYVMNNDRVVQLSSGRILLPVALHKTPESETSRGAKIMCYYSDDNAQTWRQSGIVPNPQEVVLQEPGIVQLKNGDLMLFCRTDAGSQHLTFSKDMGMTWSAVVPGPIRSPMSPASIERIPSTGDLLLVWNNNYQADDSDGGDRTPYNLAFSSDEGETWQKVKSIESNPRGWYCYTAIEFHEDFVLLGHCAGDRNKYNGLETTQITRIGLDWIYKDPAPDPLILSDSAGTVRLGCPLKKATIHFTVDGSPPTVTSGKYEEPIQVKKTTFIQLIANHPDYTESNIVSQQVGTDVYQTAEEITEKLAAGLQVDYHEGSAWVVDDIKNLPKIASAIVPKFIFADSRIKDYFAYRFRGYLQISKEGIYTFYVRSNDGSRLYLNNDLFVDNDGPHGERGVANKTALRKGTYPIGLDYFQLGGGSFLEVQWEGPGFTKKELEPAVLFHGVK